MFADKWVSSTEPKKVNDYLFEIIFNPYNEYLKQPFGVEYNWNEIENWGNAFSKTHYSPFYGFFVYPLAVLIVSLALLFGWIFENSHNSGAGTLTAIILVTLIIKLATLIFTFRTQQNQEKMTLIQAKVEKIKKHYEDEDDPFSKRKMQMEIFDLYKKENVNPLSVFLNGFLTFPILYGMFVVIRATRYLKEQKIGNISFIVTPKEGMTESSFYLLIIFLYLLIQIVNFLLPLFLTKLKQKFLKGKEKVKPSGKQLIFQGVFFVIFFFVIFSVPTGVGIYWIITGFFQLFQTLIFHWFWVRKQKNKKVKVSLKKRFIQ